MAKVLKDNLSHDTSFLHHDSVIRLRTPFRCIVHNWTKLLEVAETGSDDNIDKEITARTDLKHLMKLISTDPELAQYFQDFDPAKTPNTISFKYLWTIFPSGCLIYSKPVMERDQVFILQYCDKEETVDSKQRFSLTCWAYDWDGETFNRVPYDFYIESFSDTKSINTLDHYPLKYHRDEKGLRARLIERGMKYRDLCICKSGTQMFDYNGISIEDQKGITRQEISIRVCQITHSNLHTCFEQSITDSRLQEFSDISSVSGARGGKTVSERKLSPKVKTKVDIDEIKTIADCPFQFKGHIIIDFLSYNQYVAGGGRMGAKRPVQPYPLCNCEVCDGNEDLKRTTRSHYDKTDTTRKFVEEQYLICPPRVLGFFMVKKTWAQLLVDDVHYLEKNKGDAFKKLVLESQQKTLIKSLVSKHGQESDQREGGSQQVEDIIEGKGKGVVILLHGDYLSRPRFV